MCGAALFGVAATFTGLLLSWHLGTAAGATIAAVAVLLFFLSVLVSRIRNRRVEYAQPSPEVEQRREYEHSS